MASDALDTRSVLCTDTAWQMFGDQFRAAADGLRALELVTDRPLDRDERDSVEVAFFSADAWPERATEFMATCLDAPNLRWLHTMSAGVDHPVFSQFAQRGVRVTTSSGTSSTPIAQTVMLYLLALSRDLPTWLRAQQEHRWEPHSYAELTGSTIGVVGMGPIGLDVIALAEAFGMKPIGVRRSVRGDEPCETWTFDRLGELAGRARALVIAVPLTPETRGLITSEHFEALGPDGLFVNVARGEIVDEPALIDALTTGKLGGAGLDVTATEPLPSDSPLWDLPNVIITPHSSGATDQHAHRAAAVFAGNLGRYVRGEELRNEVTPSLA